MKFFDKVKQDVKENDNTKKINKARENALNNLTKENRDSLRYLFASFLGIAALMSLSVGIIKLFIIYLCLGIFILPILYHNPLTENIDIRIIRLLEILLPLLSLFITLLI